MIVQLLRDARTAAGLSVTDLARRIAERTERDFVGVRVQIYDYERGVHEPRAALVGDVLDALGLELRSKLVPRRRAKKRAA